MSVYQENFSQRNVKCNGWNVGSPQYNNTNTEITSNGKLHIETTVLYGGSKYDHTLVAGEEYTISMNVTHSSTSAVLYAFDGSLTSTALQQGYNELTFTAGSSNVTIGVGETVTPSGTSEFFIDNVKLIRLNGASVTESLCYGNGSVGDYRYSFQGQEHDDEVKNIKGSSYDFGARMYDPRVGRWLSRDPLAGKYVDLSAYCFIGNMPTIAIDPDGERIKFVIAIQTEVDGKEQTVHLILDAELDRDLLDQYIPNYMEAYDISKKIGGGIFNGEGVIDRYEQCDDEDIFVILEPFNDGTGRGGRGTHDQRVEKNEDGSWKDYEYIHFDPISKRNHRVLINTELYDESGVELFFDLGWPSEVLVHEILFHIDWENEGIPLSEQHDKAYGTTPDKHKHDPINAVEGSPQKILEKQAEEESQKFLEEKKDDE